MAIPLSIDTHHFHPQPGARVDHTASYPDPAVWAEKAVPFLLGLGPEQNGRPMEVPE